MGETVSMGNRDKASNELTDVKEEDEVIAVNIPRSPPLIGKRAVRAEKERKA